MVGFERHSSSCVSHTLQGAAVGSFGLPLAVSYMVGNHWKEILDKVGLHT